MRDREPVHLRGVGKFLLQFISSFKEEVRLGIEVAREN
jgi:hypothetical protein